MAKEWGYASHNGESPTGPGRPALRRPQTADCGQLQKTWVEGSDGDTTQRQRFPFAFIGQPSLGAGVTPCGSRLAPFPRPRCLQEPDLAGPAPSGPTSGRRARTSQPGAGTGRALSTTCASLSVQPTAGGGPASMAQSSREAGPWRRAGGSVSRCRRSPGCHPRPSQPRGFRTRTRVRIVPRANTPPPPAQVLTTGTSFTQSPRETTSRPSRCTRRTLSTTLPCSRGRPPTTPPPARAS